MTILEEILEEAKNLYNEIIANVEAWQPDDEFMAKLWKNLASGNPNAPMELARALQDHMLPDATLHKSRALNQRACNELNLDDYRTYVLESATTYNPGIALHPMLMEKLKTSVMKNLGLQQ